MKCTLCGQEFNETSAHTACKGCGFAKDCSLVKCPNCGFEDVPVPNWIRNFFRKKQHHAAVQTCDSLNIRLDQLEVRRKVKVTDVETQNRSALQKIIAIGVLPGTELFLIRRFPSYVLQIGRSQFSIDRELASSIYVAPCSGDERS